ncbi:MAG: MarR family transcriptional regulator [Rubrobacteraceae bacterium]
MRNVVKNNYLEFTACSRTEELLRELVRNYARLQQRVVGCCGVTGAQCQMLTEIARFEMATVGELARRLRVDKGWVSRTVATLESEGLIAKQADKDDGRLVSISLTGPGRERAAEVNRLLNKQAGRVLMRVSEERWQEAVAVLHLLVGAVREEAGKEEKPSPVADNDRD